MIGRVLRTLRVGKCGCIRPLPTRGLLAVVEVVDTYEAAPSLECLAEGRLALDPLGLGVDVRESDFDVLRTERHEAPTHYVQAAFAGLGIVVDDREGGRLARRSNSARYGGWADAVGSLISLTSGRDGRGHT